MFYSVTFQTIQNWHFHSHCINIISNIEPLLAGSNITEVEHFPHHPTVATAAATALGREIIKKATSNCVLSQSAFPCFSMFCYGSLQTIQNWHFCNHCINKISNSKPLLDNNNNMVVQDLFHYPKVESSKSCCPLLHRKRKLKKKMSYFVISQSVVHILLHELWVQGEHTQKQFTTVITPAK